MAEYSFFNQDPGSLSLVEGLYFEKEIALSDSIVLAEALTLAKTVIVNFDETLTFTEGFSISTVFPTEESLELDESLTFTITQREAFISPQRHPGCSSEMIFTSLTRRIK